MTASAIGDLEYIQVAVVEVVVAEVMIAINYSKQIAEMSMIQSLKRRQMGYGGRRWECHFGEGGVTLWG